MSVRMLTYGRFERFWHWMQAALVLFLAVTGFEIHGSLTFLGYAQAVRYHTVAAQSLIVLIAFAAFWHLTTGEWRQYVPTTALLRAQIEYYAIGIFTGAPHPSRKSRLGKLNPLQRIVYLLLKLLAMPVMVGSGLLYLLYRYPHRYGIEALNVRGLQTIAAAHTAGAFFLVAFLVVHVYLITTGTTITSNLHAMITGYEETEDEAPCVPTT
jgi:thiosulfate reductase cytochrome b subunit